MFGRVLFLRSFVTLLVKTINWAHVPQYMYVLVELLQKSVADGMKGMVQVATDEEPVPADDGGPDPAGGGKD